jgi:hypothetical protein
LIFLHNGVIKKKEKSTKKFYFKKKIPKTKLPKLPKQKVLKFDQPMSFSWSPTQFKNKFSTQNTWHIHMYE